MMNQSLTVDTAFSSQTTEMLSDLSRWNEFQNLFWQSLPYPHVCIDNFLQENLFQQVVNDFKSIDSSAAPTETYSSDIELNKVCFESSSSYSATEKVVNCLSGQAFIKILEALLGISDVIPLPRFRTENKSTRKYLHIMRDGGFLGSHVDQSHIDQTHIHILSCIFYASEKWTEEQGGHTTLFNEDGSQAVTNIEYKPNRLSIFLHTSTSFHGVSKLKTDSNRYSIYMDYYLPVNNLEEFKSLFIKFTHKEKPKYWEHDVIFFSTNKKSSYTQQHNQYQINSQDVLMHFGPSNNLQKLMMVTKKKLGKLKDKVIGKIKTLLSK